MTFIPSAPFEISALIVFGVLLLVGATGGYIAHRLSWLPSITGFIAVGFLIGPSGLALLSQEAIINSEILIDIALALILYRLGLSLDLREIRRRPKILLVSVIESAATFLAVLWGLYLFGLPVIVAAVIAVIVISSSPAVLLHVAHETGAEGPVTQSTLTLVALNNCICFAAYSAILPLLHHSVGSSWGEMLLQPIYRLFGSIFLGLILGISLHHMAVRMKAAPQYKLAIAMGTLMIAIGMADYLKLSMLIVPLVMGVTISTVEQEAHVSSIEFGSTFELFFIVLFVYAGANLHFEELANFSLVVFSLVLIRCLTKCLCVTSTSYLYGLSARQGISSALLLTPMAGLAIGLAQTTSSFFPVYGATVSAIVLGSVVVLETIGPPLSKVAFDFCGESSRVRSREALTAPEPEAENVQSEDTKPSSP